MEFNRQIKQRNKNMKVEKYRLRNLCGLCINNVLTTSTKLDEKYILY